MHHQARATDTQTNTYNVKQEGVIHFVLGESVKSVEVRCELGPEGYGGLMGKTRKDQ